MTNNFEYMMKLRYISINRKAIILFKIIEQVTIVVIDGWNVGEFRATN